MTRTRADEKAAAEGTAVPWDVGVPQPALASPAVVDRFKGRVLDAGSGLGCGLCSVRAARDPPLLSNLVPRPHARSDNTRWLASLPGVTAAVGIDVSPAAVEGANARLAGDADARDKCSFRVASLADPPAEGEAEPPFDALLDCGVFHCVEDEARYLRALTPRVRVGGSAVALEFSDGNPPFEEGMPGPRRVSEAHAREAWGAAGWRVDSVERVKARCVHGVQACREVRVDPD